MVFDDQVRDRAGKRSQLSRRNHRTDFDLWLELLSSIGLLALAGASSPVSQLTLSPVYGSIPASIYHQRIVSSTILLAAFLYALSSHIALGFLSLGVPLLPFLACLLPITQNLLFKNSESFGPILGPPLTELCTFIPLLYLAALGTIIAIGTLGKDKFGHLMMTCGATILTWAIFKVVQQVSQVAIQASIGTSAIFTRSGFQYTIAALYLFLKRSRLNIVVGLLLLYNLSQNYHIPLNHTTSILNQTLWGHNFSVIARQESLTGYISVLENREQGFRAMRCDHSLLGGEWIDKQGNPRSQLGEPIYSCFVMLEAVRLIEASVPEHGLNKKEDKKQALVIGLGIGTAPSAMIAHGIETTIVEIDPIVHRYASKYFHLPNNHTSVTRDAVTFVTDLQTNGQDRGRYDYIIHDVFTGGAEPIELFTQDFLEGLNYLLNADGVVAINYGGDLLLESAALVVHTVLLVFPQCRLFREEPAPSSADKIPEKDFTNMIMFCRKSPEAFTFRKPVEADFLSSQARREVLLPEHEVQSEYFDRPGTPGQALRKGHTAKLVGLHQRSAVNHWHIMRTVVPSFVWEHW